MLANKEQKMSACVKTQHWQINQIKPYHHVICYNYKITHYISNYLQLTTELNNDKDLGCQCGVMGVVVLLTTDVIKFYSHSV